MIPAIYLALAMASVGATPGGFDVTHWNTDPASDIFKIGTFTAADEQGWPAGWQDRAAFETGHGRLQPRGRGTVMLRADDDGRKVAISTTIDLPPNTEYVTFAVKMRGPNIERGNTENAGGGVTFSLASGAGERREFPRIDPSYAGYRDWQNHVVTARVLPAETKLHVSIALLDATGELEVDDILVIPSDAENEATAEQSRLLRLAIETDDPEAMAQLIKDDPRMLEMRTGQNDNGTPLIGAAWTGSPKVAAKLIELGANIEAQDPNWGNTPLRWSAWWGTHEVAAVLIAAGADPRWASGAAQSAKKANGAAKRPAEDFDQVSRLVDEYEAKLAKEASEAVWPRFRGPNGTGVATSGQFPSELDPQKNAVWKTPLPHGVSSPCMWGDRIFLTSFDKATSKLETICLRRESGEILWRQEAPAKQIEKVHEVSSPASATPATDGERVYVYFCSYGLLCYDLAGELKWQRELAPIRSRFGSGTSPVVFGTTVFLNRDGDLWQPVLLAVDGRTGEDVWRAERSRWAVGYSTPIVSQRGAKNELVLVAAGRLAAYDTSTGQQQWFVNGLPAQTCASPVLGDGRVHVSATGPFGEPENYVAPPAFNKFLAEHDINGDGLLQLSEVPNDLVIVDRRTSTGAGNTSSDYLFRGLDGDQDKVISEQEWEGHTKGLAAMLDVKPALMAVRTGGTGDVGQTHIAWNETRGVSEVPTPLLYKQRLYTVRNGGIVHCRDPRTGKEFFGGRLGAGGGYYASPVAGDDKIYFASDRGDVTVISADDRLNVIARSALGEPIYATPALVGNTIYVRTDSHIYAFADR